MINNPILEKKDNTIYIIYEYVISHVTQNKKRKLKDGTIKTNTIYTNRATFPYDLYKLLEIKPDDEEKEYIYFTKHENNIQINKKPPATYDEIKKIRLNKRTAFTHDTVNPETSRRSKIISIPRNIFPEANNKTNIKYVLNTKTETINCILTEEI